ncbi:hypothetical protein [Alloalcanivorax venustensis]|uniref:hypothetical protein n=1 Tax=Alloalcanivorax venustensis TaxID=172371 RepID=UPI0039C351E0
MLRIGVYAQFKHAYAQLSMLCAVNVAHRRLAKGRESAASDDELKGFLMATTTVGMKTKGISMQSGMLTVGARINSWCAMRLRQWTALVLCERFTQSCRLKGSRQASVGSLLE